MLDAIFKAIQDVVSFINSAWLFLKNAWDEIVQLVTMLKDFLVSIPQLVGFLPASIASLIILGFGVVVLYKIMGREG